MNLPSLAAIAQAIDDHYDEEEYGVVYNEDGVCIDSAAARAVLALLRSESGIILTPDDAALVLSLIRRDLAITQTEEHRQRLYALTERIERSRREPDSA
jgi:hypothetical protein